MPRLAVTALCLICASLACRSETPETTAHGTVLAVADSPEIGRYLTDAAGRALYVRAADGKSKSTCYDNCAEIWRAAPGSNAPPRSEEPAIQQELVGTVPRRNGAVQITYAGRPLYYAPEGAPLQRSITDQWGSWSLVFPHGEPMVTPP